MLLSERNAIGELFSECYFDRVGYGGIGGIVRFNRSSSCTGVGMLGCAGCGPRNGSLVQLWALNGKADPRFSFDKVSLTLGPMNGCVPQCQQMQ